MKLWPFGRKANEDGSARNSLDLFRLLSGGRATKSGLSVNNASALEVTVVLACVRVIAEGIAQVPLKLFRDDGTNKSPATDHPLYAMLHRKPNPWMSSFDLRETMAIHAVLTGNAVAFVNRLPSGRILEIIPLKPGNVRIEQREDWSLVYHVAGKDGVTRPFPPEAIWHWRGPSWDGVVGLEVVKNAREAIGLAMATEEAHAGMHKNGARVSGLYSVEGKLTADQYKLLKKWIDDNHAAEKAGSTMLLDNGAKFTPMTMTGVDAQHLETRRYQVEEICRAFRVMPIMAGYSDKAATYASAEQMFLAHVVHTLSPWYERIEQSIDCQLLTDKEVASGLYAKFITAGLLRGSLKDRSEYLAKALGAGGSPAWMTQDEVRALEELNPMGGSAAVLPLPTNVGKQPTGEANGN